MRKILLTSSLTLFLFGCGPDDRGYSCEGVWNKVKTINQKVIAENKNENESFEIKYIFYGNLIQRLIGSIPKERFIFMKEWWGDEGQVERIRDGIWIKGKVNYTEMSSVITNSKYYIGNLNRKEENTDTKTYWYSSQWFQLDRLTGKIEYELKSESNEDNTYLPTYEISKFMGKCSKVSGKL